MTTRPRIRNWLTSAAIFTSLGAVSMSAPAVAATVQHFLQKGAGAEATWYQSDNCGYSYVNLYATVGATPNGGSATKYVVLQAFTTNYCTGIFDFVYTPDGFATQTNFSVNGSLTKATLTGTIPIYVCSGNNCGPHTAAVNLTWVNTDRATHVSSTYHSVGPAGMFKSRTAGMSDPATTSGTIVRDNTVSLLSDLPFQNGDMFDSMSGEITVVNP
jgi:hypothetical protein